jgi:hypothetical protein
MRLTHHINILRGNNTELLNVNNIFYIQQAVCRQMELKYCYCYVLLKFTANAQGTEQSY